MPGAETHSGLLKKSASKGAIRIAAFFLSVTLLAFALNSFITAGLRRVTTSKFGAFNDVMAGRADAEIIISGSSRALDHYDPRVIKRITGCPTFGLGMNGSKIDVELAVLKTHLKHNATPKVVIQNLDLSSLELTREGEILDPVLFVPYLYENELYEPLRAIDPVVWKWKHIPLYGYAVADMRFTWIWGVLSWLGVNVRQDYHLGFTPQHQGWTGDFDRFKASHPNGVSSSIEPEGVRDLEEMIRTCREKGIRLVLAYSPEYIEMQALETNRREIMNTFREISERLNVPFWDYSDSSICRDRANFYNSQHLNAEGAEAFSTGLAHRLIDSGLLQAPPRANQ